MLQPMDCYISKTVLIIALFAATSGCATIKPIPAVKTRTLEFRVDDEINQNQILPVDIIYITYVQELRSVVRYGPELWFESERRLEWKNKESLGIEGGKDLKIALNPDLMEKTTLIVIFADFKNVTDPAKQQVIIDYGGQNSETVLVKADRLEPQNKSLRYLQ